MSSKPTCTSWWVVALTGAILLTHPARHTPLCSDDTRASLAAAEAAKDEALRRAANAERETAAKPKVATTTTTATTSTE